MHCRLPGLDLHVGPILHAAARLAAAHPAAVALFIAVPLLALPLLLWVERRRRRRARVGAAPSGAPRLAFPLRHGRAGAPVPN